MNINGIKALCEKNGFKPNKSYGQNYLINDGIVKKIIEAVELKPEDTVVEIGPGFGVLTFALAEKVEKVIAFEIERKLEKYWSEQKEIKKLSNLEIVWGNALKNFQFSIFNFQFPYKIVANIPYQITSQLLRTILEIENKPSLIVVMVQKEVAQRICAKKGEMSLLALSVQYYGKPEIVDFVTKGNFWPAPNVDSAILRVTLAPERLSALAPELFFRFARAGFAKKRKQLWRNLAKGLNLDEEKVKMVLKEVMGDEKVRAEELSVDDWLRIIPSLS